MASPTPMSPNATPKEVAAVRARLLAEAATRDEKAPAARLCPTVRRLLESRRQGAQGWA